MDPNLFHIDWDRVLEALVAIVILSFLVERVAALLFESRFFAHNTKLPSKDSIEAEREANAVKVARAIIDAKGKKEAIEAALADLTPSNPHWPGSDVPPDELEERARKVLKRTRTLHERRQRLSRIPLKELIAFIVASAVCLAWHFDAFSIVLLSDHTSWQGSIATGAVVAGGSKASIRLFQDLLGVRSEAMREIRTKEDDKDKKRDGRDGGKS